MLRTRHSRHNKLRPVTTGSRAFWVSGRKGSFRGTLYSTVFKKSCNGARTTGKFFLVFLVILSSVVSGYPLLPQKPQEAKAAAGEIILLSTGAVPAGWTSISPPFGTFWNVFPRASSTYGSAAAGALSHTHYLSSATSTVPSVTTTSGQAAGTAAPSNVHTHSVTSTLTDSPFHNPPFHTLIFIKAATTTLPNGIIGMFEVSATSALPSLWSYYTQMDGKYLLGYDTSSTGGNATSTHSVSLTTTGATSSIADSANTSGLVGDNNHTHAVSGSLDADDNDPPYATIVFAQLTATTTLSGTSTPGLVAFFDDVSLPTDWTIISDASSTYSGRLLKGGNAASLTGGTSTHNHGGIEQFTTGGPSATKRLASGATVNVSNTNHTHTTTVTISSASHMPVYRDVILGRYRAGITQSSFRWYNNLDSTDLIGINSNVSTGTDKALAVAVDATSSALYVVGYDSTPGNNEWRIEKRSTASGTLLYATTTNPSSGDDIAYGIEIDSSSSAMYVVGSDRTAGGSDDGWRIEKRNLSDGSLVYATTTNPSTSTDIATGISIDISSGAMYVVGYDKAPGNNEWRIEKRNLSDGSLVYATTTNPTSHTDTAQGLALDINGGFMYAVGDSNAGDWRIEKRNLSDGSLVYATTTSAGIAQARAIAVDTQEGGFYVAGYQNSGFGLSVARFEKRTASTGALVYATTTDTGFFTSFNDVELDVQNSAVYVAGHGTEVGTISHWRIERRTISDGSLTYVATSSPGSVVYSAVQALSLDRTNGLLYAVGETGSEFGWRIERRNLSDSSTAWGAALAGVSTAAVAPSQGTPFRLRLALHASGTLARSAGNFKLQFAQQSGTCDTSFSGESYADVATSSGAIQFFNNASIADGATISTSTQDPTHGSDAMLAETYEESNNFTNSSTAVTYNQDGLFDLSLVDATAASSTTYCFRAVNSDGTIIDTYNVIPEIKTGGLLNLSAYRLFSNLDSRDPAAVDVGLSGGTWTQAYGVAYDSTSLYTVGIYVVVFTSIDWYIEKRSIATGTREVSFGTNGEVYGSSTSNYGQALAVDSGSLYIAGSDDSDNLRIEKRSASSGAGDTSFGTSGVVTGSSTSNIGYGIAVSSSYVYTVGRDDTPGWRVEKRSASSGAGDTSFGTNGVVTGAASSNIAYAIAIDASSMYVAGNSTNTVNWRIEKRSLSDGSLVSGFGSGGVISGASTSTTPYGIAIDASNMYVVGQSSGTLGWRIEKRSLSDGSLVFATSSAAGTNSLARTIAIDGSYMYVGGDDPNSDWRIEKRALSNGSFDASFGSGGVATSIKNSRRLYGIAVASSEVYAVGDSSGGTSWRIEKRSPTDGSLGWGTALAALNTATTTPREGTPFRMRTLVHNNGSTLAANTQTFKLQIAQKSGTCDTSFSGEVYGDVATSTGAIRYYDNVTPSDAATVPATSTYDPTHGSDVIALQAYEESNISTNSTALLTAEDGLWDFALVDQAAPASTAYCMRLVKSNGDAIDNYTVIPEIQARSLPGTPGTPTFSSVTTSTVTVSWTTATLADYYRLERSTGSFSEIATTTALTYNDTGLAASTTYSYRVRATNEKGNGSYSGTGSVRTKLGYAASGTLTSLIIDTAVTNGVAPNALYWEGTLPASSSVKFQFAAATSSLGPWTYQAWSSSANTCNAISYYAPSGPDVPVEVKALCHQNKRFLRYKVLLESYATNTTPTVDRVILNYAQ